MYLALSLVAHLKNIREYNSLRKNEEIIDKDIALNFFNLIRKSEEINNLFYRDLIKVE